MNLKSALSLAITIAFVLAFCYVVYMFSNEDTAHLIITAFITVATSVIGYFIGYQANKKDDDITEEE